MTFKTWLLTFVEEKELDKEQIIEVEGNSGTNIIPLGCVIEAMITAPKHEQDRIKTIIVAIDFRNGDVMHFFKEMAKALAI